MMKKEEKKQEVRKGDVAIDHELSMAVMNLISIEEHLACTIGKTGDKEYLELYNQIRSLRSKYMKKIVTNKKGESWCIAKHLLSTTMRLIETGVKHGALGEVDEAVNMFTDAMDTFQVFFLMQKMSDSK